MLLSGALTPTTGRLLARRLTAQNRDELLAAAAGKSRQQVEELLARRFPQPDVPSAIRLLPAPISLRTDRSEILAAGHEVPTLGVPCADSPPEPPRAAEPPGSAAAPRPLIRPLSADRYEDPLHRERRHP
jgi:hypothetical protein